MTVISLSLLLFMLSCRAWGAQLAAADGAMNWAVSSSSLASAKSSPSTKILAFVSQPTKTQSHQALHASNLSCATMFNARFDSPGIVFKYRFPPTRSRYYADTSSYAQNNCHHSCCHQHITTQLYSTINDDNDNILQQTTANVIERLELNQQFERWKFLQQLLDGEIQPLDIENVLILVLSSYLQHGPTALTSDNKDENGGNASPVLNDEQMSNMRGVINDISILGVSDNGIGDSRFLHMLVLPPVDYESMTIDIMEDEEDSNIIEVDTNALSILQQIERLLPDPIEDEEAYNSLWDVVIDLYGRESVKIKETALQQEKESSRYIVSSSSGNLECCVNNLQWRALCTVGRVLIHYDFLTKGVLNEDTFRY